MPNPGVEIEQDVSDGERQQAAANKYHVSASDGDACAFPRRPPLLN